MFIYYFLSRFFYCTLHFNSVLKILGMETSKIKLEALPPPPPPPPPFPKASKSNSYAPVSFRITSSSKHSKPFPISRYIGPRFCKVNKSIVTYYKDIEPILQNGPLCGIVALSMASQFFDGKCWKAKDILSTAKSLQFTKNGEMFSAGNMATLAESVLGCKATVVSNLTEGKRDILNCICRGCPVLVPYDADKNHHPCLNNGRNAHWAILNGVCLVLSEEVSDLGYESWGDVDYAFRLTSGKNAEKYLDSAIKTCVFAYQGKSRHMALWNYETLVSSNRNMFEVTTSYSSENMLLPNGDNVLSELRDKAVLLES